MKVCLRRGYHPVYDELVKNPPEGIEYHIPGMVTKSSNRLVDTLKKKAWHLYLDATRQPSAVTVPYPRDAELLHACAGILPKNRRPWVIDMEHANSFVSFQAGKLDRVKDKIEDYLRSDSCRKLMPWTEAGKESITNYFDMEGIEDKIEVVYPAMRPLEDESREHEGLNVLFVSKRFFTKGGKEVLEAYDRLKDDYDFHLRIVSEVPEEMREEYPDVEFQEPNVPREELLRDYFGTADIFLLPSYMDTFGMVYLEAMSYSIPIVATNNFALPEMLGDCARLVDVSDYSWYDEDKLFAWDSWDDWCELMEETDKPEIVDGLVEELSKLLEDEDLRNELGRKGRKEIEDGKFSLANRNEKLGRIYEEAVE